MQSSFDIISRMIARRTVSVILAVISVVVAPMTLAQDSSLVTTQRATTRPWLGFGFNQYPQNRNADGSDRPWTEDDWRLTFDRVATISPALVRINTYRRWFNSDERGQSLPVGQYRWDSPEFQAYCRVLRWYQLHQVPVLSGLWHAGFEEKPDARFCTSSGPGSFAQLQVDLLVHLRDVEKITCVRWYTPFNEPAGVGISYEDYATTIRRTHEAFVAAGLKQQIVAADAWDEWTAESARRVGPILAGYEHHKYLNDGQGWLRDGGLERYLRDIDAEVDQADPDRSKPIFLGEAGAEDIDRIDWWARKPQVPDAVTPGTYSCAVTTLDYAVQVLRSGHSGALIWSLDGFDSGKDSGMWKLDGTEAGRRLRPWYYGWSLVCRSFPRRCERAKARDAGRRSRCDGELAGQRVACLGQSHPVARPGFGRHSNPAIHGGAAGIRAFTRVARRRRIAVASRSFRRAGQ